MNVGFLNGFQKTAYTSGPATFTGPVFFSNPLVGATGLANNIFATFPDQPNAQISTGFTNGTIFGGGFEKIGFFGHAPAGGQSAATDLGTVLSNLGIRSAGTAYPVTTSGTITGGAHNAAGAITSSSATGGVGYATGAGGVVTQGTSRVTGVTLSKVSGQITLFTATLAADTDVTFTLTNTAIAATDIMVFNVVSGAAVKGCYKVNAICAAGSAQITVSNVTPTITASEAPVIGFVVIKGVTA